MKIGNRRRLTEHQTDVFRRLAERHQTRARIGRERIQRDISMGYQTIGQLTAEGWVQITRRGHEGFGNTSAIIHLRAKGYIETKVELGPRGGEIVFARPVKELR
jgi:hypothetical protein